MSGLPTTPESLTVEWLTGVLRESGALPGGRVVSLTVDRQGLAPGFFGDIARLQLGYEGVTADLPRTMIAKFPTAEPGAFDIGLQRGYYEREVVFYREHASACGLRVPRCYGSAIDHAGGASVLLLEDLSVYRAGTAPSPSRAADALAVVRQLSAFHARWWDSTELAAYDWLPPASAGAERFQRDFVTAWPTVLERLGGLSRPAAQVGEWVAKHVPRVKEALTAAPAVFLHADLRDENLFFVDERTPTMVAVDWQHCRRGRAPLDVAAYLFGVAADTAPADEHALLVEYHRALLDAGVEGYAFEDCVRDYELAMVDRFVSVGSTLATVDPDSTGGQMALEYLSRCGMSNFVRYARAIEAL